MTLAPFGRAVPEIAQRLAAVREKDRGRADAGFLGEESGPFDERVVEALEAQQAREPGGGGVFGAHDAPWPRAS